jgi:hypothetical protein
MNLLPGLGLALSLTHTCMPTLAYSLLNCFFDNYSLLTQFSDEHGDRPRPLPDIKELKNAIDVTFRKENPAWDYDVCV